MAQLNPVEIRKDFPILKRKIHGKPLVYLDSASTSQKPKQVIDAISKFYKTSNANIHRALYTLSDEATTQYELARKKVADFIHASSEEIIFTRNATEAINLVMQTVGKTLIQKNDLILTTEMEHHSNLVPWQQLAKEKGAKLKFIPIIKEGILDLDQAKKLFNEKPKLFACTHISNVLGTINPIKELIQLAHAQKTIVLIDGAQSIPHLSINVKDLDCDFFVASGHKMLAPTGIGFLYGKKELLEKMSPFLFGGDMIKEVSYQDASWNDLPWKFEAGTPDIAGVIGLGAAIDYLQSIGIENIHNYEQELTKYALEQLQKIPQVRIVGPKDRAGVIAFNVGDIHAHDLTTIFDSESIAIRSGHHCAQPLTEKLGEAATARMSFYLYNTKEEIDQAIKAIHKAKKVFKL